MRVVLSWLVVVAAGLLLGAGMARLILRRLGL